MAHWPNGKCKMKRTLLLPFFAGSFDSGSCDWYQPCKEGNETNVKGNLFRIIVFLHGPHSTYKAVKSSRRTKNPAVFPSSHEGWAAFERENETCPNRPFSLLSPIIVRNNPEVKNQFIHDWMNERGKNDGRRSKSPFSNFVISPRVPHHPTEDFLLLVLPTIFSPKSFRREEELTRKRTKKKIGIFDFFFGEILN